MSTAIITEAEYKERLKAVRKQLHERQVDAALIFSPENIYYLLGLSHQGYFAFTMLIVPLEGKATIVTRSMERVTVTTQTPDVHHIGFEDGEEPANAAIRAVRETKLDRSTLGIERTTMFFPVAVWDEFRAGLEDARFRDISALVENLRAIKTPSEIASIRQAAALSDRAVRAGIHAAGVGVNEREVAAQIYRAMMLGGSEYPGFAPLVRSSDFLLQEHVTWRDRVLVPGDGLFMELSASINRYHAPLTRMVHVGHAPAGVREAAEIVTEALYAVVDALAPGAVTGDVYDAWQAVVDQALGHSRYRRHHCGYPVGIGFPPSWVGGSRVVGIRPHSTEQIKAGMTFHVLSWLLDVGPADYGVSDTVLVTEGGAELLTSTNRAPLVIH
jgi:Xaa-Pro dipeptidase